MHALVTGGAGFIGSHLAEHLLAEGHRVRVIDDLSTGRLQNISELQQNPSFDFVLGSILDQATVARAMEGIDTVFHLAAAVGVELVVEHPLEGLKTNIRGTEVVFEAAERRRARVLVTSTSEIYGKNRSDSLSEDDDRILGSPLKSRWSYSEAKAIEEIFAFTYWRQTGLPTVIVRLFNTVGPRQSDRYGMVLPRFIRQAVAGQPLTVHGDGTQTRCFCSVHDVVPALVALLAHPEATGKVFNVGSREEISIEELARKVITLSGSDSKIRYIPYEEAYEEGFEDMPRRVPDITKVNALIGFQPRWTLDDIIQELLAERHQEASAGL
jgi:UDP-glucose 4-epimerase